MTADLDDYRRRRAAARAMHPSVRPVWAPADAIATAQAFHAELAHAEVGSHGDEPVATAVMGEGHTPRLGCATPTLVERQRQSATELGERLIFGRSRFRRAAFLDGLAVTMLLSLMGALGVVVWAGSARADTGDAAAYAAEHAAIICGVLDDYPGAGGVVGVAEAIVETSGMSYLDAGEAMYDAVSTVCPRHLPALMRVAGKNTPGTAVVGVA